MVEDVGTDLAQTTRVPRTAEAHEEAETTKLLKLAARTLCKISTMRTACFVHDRLDITDIVSAKRKTHDRTQMNSGTAAVPGAGLYVHVDSDTQHNWNDDQTWQALCARLQ